MTNKIHLRPIRQSDLPIFFNQQLDPQANLMAAFTAENPTDRAAFDDHWAKITADKKIIIRTITLHDEVAGHIARFERAGDREITYWIGRQYWGRGIATAALTQFLAEQKERPLFARAAHDNHASMRVLQKCGFKIHSTAHAFAPARRQEIAEIILKLP